MPTLYNEKIPGISEEIAFIRDLANRGGPTAAEYPKLTALMAQLEFLSSEALEQLRAAFGEALNTTDTMQGFAYIKPHGYAGDFEIIDRIYRSKCPPIRGWPPGTSIFMLNPPRGRCEIARIIFTGCWTGI